MTISNVAIANRALQKLGTSDRIASLTEDSPNARTMNAAFDITRRAELRRYDWSFAIARASIAADAADTTWGDWNRYTLPNDFLKLIRDDETGQHVDWRIEGLYIVTADDSPLEIRYVADIEDPTFFDALFIEALASKLAVECCQEVTGSTGKKADAKDDYAFAIAEAKRIGAIEKPAAEFMEDSWLNARL
jgi:hypothetical protein